MKTQKEILEDFYEFCEGRVAFSLNDSTHYEGYFFEILNDTFMFFLGGPLAPDEPVEIKICDVNLDSLCYVDYSVRKWKTAMWKNETSIWEIKDYIPSVHLIHSEKFNERKSDMKDIRNIIAILVGVVNLILVVIMLVVIMLAKANNRMIPIYLQYSFMPALISIAITRPSAKKLPVINYILNLLYLVVYGLAFLLIKTLERGV